jgi:CubicO group peptidase (beta-lactamase class C family)
MAGRFFAGVRRRSGGPGWGAAVAACLSVALMAGPRIGAQEDPASEASGLGAAIDSASGLPRLHSLLVSQHGELILERYFGRTRPTTLANIKSASKSVISALVGIAIDRGLIADVHQPIAPFFPTLLGADVPGAAGTEEAKRQITIEHLLTMRSGLQSTSNRYYGAWVQSPNWVRHALTRPLLGLPGAEMDYSTGNTHLLSAILTRVSGKSTWQFAQEALARPLGFSLARWPTDPQGVFFGGNDMLMTPRQMAAFGELYLNRGRSDAEQIVPERWVDSSWIPRARSAWSDQMYGYGWWIRDLAGYRTAYAWGYGGQYIFIVPDLDLVVVTTSASDVSSERRGHRRTVLDVVEHLIIAPLGASAGRSVSAAPGPGAASAVR